MSMSPRLLRPRATRFNVRSLPGLVSWYDASDIATLLQNSNGTTSVSAANDPVGYWKDKHGSNNLIQATANNRPFYAPAGINGKPAVLFDGVNDVLRATPATAIASSGVTVLSVYAVQTATEYAPPPFMLGSGPNPRPFDRYHSSGGSNLAFVGSSFATASLNLRTKTTPFIYGVVITKDGVSSGVHTFAEYANGVLSGPYSVASTYSTASQVFSVGARADGATLMNGWASEIIVCDGVLPATRRATAEKYLAAKWGVTL